MTKVFLDTSIFIRLFTKDVLEKYRQCLTLFEVVEEGRVKPYTSNIVLLEIFYVLTSVYRFKSEDVRDALDRILRIRNITLIEKTNTDDALQFFDKYKIKFADCLIATQVPDGAKLVSYDAEFRKIPTLNAVSPQQLLS